MVFQSFLSWNWLLKKIEGFRNDSSIHGFNPSYRGIGFWSRSTRPATVYIRNVSILLIVELAFEGTNFFHFPVVDIGFNPSYRGIGFWSAKHAPLQLFQSYVSILLIVELAFEGRLLLLFYSWLWLFQSFLSWNWLLKGCTPLFLMGAAFVSILLIVELAFEALGNDFPVFRTASFNPSYRGIGFWRICRKLIQCSPNQFQSFLSWNWLLKLIC